MKLPLVALLSLIMVLAAARCWAVGYSNSVQVFVDFRGGTPGEKITVTTLTNSTIGYQHWEFNGNYTGFQSFYYATNYPIDFLTPQAVMGTNYTNSGTKTIRYTHGQTNDFEYILWKPPGPTQVTFSNMVYRGLVRFAATNTSASAVNFDHLQMQGASYCICQEETQGNGSVGTLWRIKAHTSIGNGTPFDIDPLKTYWLEMIRDQVRGECIIRLYDPATGELVGTSQAGANEAGANYIILSSGYLDSGRITTGFTEFGPFSITFSNESPALSMPLLLESFVRSNRFEWQVGTNTGVIGGIPSPGGTVIDVTQAPYNADNSGSVNAGNAINSAIAAAVSNDIVYLPPGIYNCITNAIVLNASGVVLRGAGINSVIHGHVVDGHSLSGGETYSITNGGNRGTTNLMVNDIDDPFSQTIEAGDIFSIYQQEDTTNETFQIIGTTGTIGGLRTTVRIHSRSGYTLNLDRPLLRDFTNNAKLVSLSQQGVSSARFKERIGIENLKITSTNNGLVDPAGVLLAMTSLRNSWVRGCTIEYPNNYCIDMTGFLNNQIESNRFGKALSVGTSRSALTLATGSGALVQNNAFYDLTIGVQCQGGSFSANAIFANYFTNISDKAILFHSAHPFYNLIEANVGNIFVPDGYFGSSSHNTVFGNEMEGTQSYKRFNTYHTVVGNLFGQNGVTQVYEQEESGFSTYPIFTFGYPNIGNNTYTRTSPPVPWNFSGHFLNSGAGGGPITNFGFTVNTTVGPTNVLWTNFFTEGAAATFTNIMYVEAMGIMFQGPNTNSYWPVVSSNGLPLTAAIQAASSNGTPSNVVMNQSITISNGWRLILVGQNGFQQRQTANKATYYVSGNLAYTNAPGTVVWDDRTADRSLPRSILYPRSPPEFWGTHRWPAKDPAESQPDSPIPAETWFYAGGEIIHNIPATPGFRGFIGFRK